MIKLYKHLAFAWVDCEKYTELAEKYEVETVPTMLLFHPHKTEVDKLVNPSPGSLDQEIEKQNEYYKIGLAAEKERVFKEIEVILGSAPLVAFIKGTPTEPKCKFTKRLLAHFSKLEIAVFKSFNILEDPRIRQWLKVYSNWQTYPQIYINKEFIGGIDVIDELVENDEFLDVVPKECKKQPPIDIFENMLDSFDLVVLIQGTPENTKCEKSKSILELMSNHSLKYVTVDYESLEGEVQSHVKSKYNVDSYPYIFLKHSTFGNEEVLKKQIEDGNLESIIPEGSRKLSLNDSLKKLTSKYYALM
jgi:glutaredoxin-related protein